MPETDPNVDLHREGDFNDTSLESVKAYLGDLDNVIYCPGWFPESSEPAKDRSFCFVYVDVDIYRSVKDAVSFFYPRLVPGGIMIFDDYMSRSCPGVKQALDEFLEDKTESVVVTARSQCLLMKD